jgi:uncharacterized membrane protein
MERLVRAGRIGFAVALIGLGIDHFIFQQFVSGRPPAWADPSGWAPFAYLTGLLVAGTGLAVLTGKQARLAAAVCAALILLLAVPRHLPALASSAAFSSAWTRFGKALWLIGGSLTIASTFPPSVVFSRVLNRDRQFLAVGRITLGLFQILTGIQHFLHTPFVASLIPAWFPGNATWWTWFAGVALIAGGLGLLLPRTARWAALLSGLMILSWFFIVHLSRELAGGADGIAVFEALADAGVLLVIAGVLSRPGRVPLTAHPAAVAPLRARLRQTR